MYNFPILSAFFLAASLCADCFAVTSCSSTTLRGVSWRKVLPIAFAFGTIHVLFMLTGWLFGDVFVGIIEKAAGVVGFLLLLYVGASMIVEAVRGKTDERNLSGLKAVIVSSVATSIDAFAVGISLSMDRRGVDEIILDLATLFIVTIITVSVGIFGGSKVGEKFGKPAEMAGGCVLILIGVAILI